MRRSDTKAEDEFDEADLFSDVALWQPSKLSFADHVYSSGEDDLVQRAPCG